MTVEPTPPGAPLTLWYTAPATSWEEESLPIGNGALGAGVFGGVAREVVVLNEKTLWTGGPGSREGYDHGDGAFAGTDGPDGSDGSAGAEALREVRRRLAERGGLPAEEVAALLGSPRRGYGAHQVLGHLRLDFADAAEPVADYRRELRLAEGLATVRYRAGGVTHTREYLASRPDGVIAVRLAADRPGRLSLTVSVDTPREGRRLRGSVAAGRILLDGTLEDNGLRHTAGVDVVPEGGTLVDGADGTVTVTGADAVTVLVAAGTDYAPTPATGYRGDDPCPRVTAALDAARAKGYPALRAAHLADHRELFDRVALDIGQVAPELPTDRLLAAYTGGDSPADRALEALYFQYGRYLLIASSRPGTLPANLQGVWNDSTTPPWSADYHVNINLQMNYWPAEVTNLAETTAPLFDFVDALRGPGARTARRLHGARGWVVHDETNPFGFTGLHDWPTAFWFPEAAAWLATHLHEHWRFGGDEDFLRRRAYPVLQELVRFWTDELVEDARDGLLVVSPSYSPEHGDFTAGAAMSQQIVHELFACAVEAAEALGDAAFAAEARAVLRRLDPGLRTGSWGQLREWKDDLDDPADDHRHVSHLFALYPGRRISPTATPALADAARTTLDARGDGSTGWSRAWKVALRARLGDGDRAHALLAGQLRESTLGNLWDTHPPFQIDGNFGATAGVAEMLLQSHDGVVHVLPALPAAWRARGSVRGLRSRGGLTVDAAWRDGVARSITLTAHRDGTVRLRSGLLGGAHRLWAHTPGGPEPVHARPGGAPDTVEFPVRAGRRYTAERPAR
ncbi:glycoside hydrolase family 95 protein [Allostreptomyces psammosilenae]|uniref:Alpha-L-fucosidase 2 n=1 Tax=Allostreptomyces psammosilenae TaxID=1892865 RepID=A0A852ZTS5_9ACTN|nr:glycoside hydrolase family 95 protein [Allostreptomyces psammosilenae]NYI04957.1 alpha-L-fucosidase 2 [Allostreptomyces psammosilenae]